MKRINPFLSRISNKTAWGYGLFWSWNLIFLAFMILGFAPNVLVEILDAIRRDLIPNEYLVLGILVTLIPVAAVYLGLTHLRRSPEKLLALGYGVEGPLMVLCLARIFLIRQATPAMVLLYTVALLGVFTLLWQILDRWIDQRGFVFDVLRMTGLTLLFLVGIYAAVLVAFYAIPIAIKTPELAWGAAREFWWAVTHLDWESLVMLPFTVLGILLALFTATLLVAAPAAIPVLYTKNWWMGLNSVMGRRNRWLFPILTAGIFLGTGVVFIFANQQPQHKAYQLLLKPPQTVEEAGELLLQQDVIRKGLLNAYLAPVRYISSVGEVGHIRDLYQWSLGISDEAALSMEKAFEVPARPMLYEPMSPSKIDQSQSVGTNQRALRTEPQEAARFYEAFFDVPITEGERETIIHAVRNTWSGDQALLAWQAVDDREVLLVQQQINISAHGDWAEVELFEVYQNQTSTRQEVIYYFSLPESAVLTGVWLGESPDREARYGFQVAPRGAAQQVYREQLRVNIDPALLEQIGPRQYRLRVFPIEPQRWRWDDGSRRSIVNPGPPTYMWMTYSVLAEGDSWPLPQLAEKANVYWDETSVREVNGQPIEATTRTWLPPSVAAAAPVPAVAHQVTFPSGETVYLRPSTSGDHYPVPSDLRLAVVLDRSRSMAEIEMKVSDVLAQLETTFSDVDVYLTASEYRGEGASISKLASLVPNKIIFYGGQNAADLLAQFFTLSVGRSYDATLVLTDSTGFKLGGEKIKLQVPDMPLWMIHLDGAYPLGYDDATLQVLQASGGGVAGSLDEALTRLAVSLHGAKSSGSALRDVLDGYEWVTIFGGDDLPEGADPVVHSPDDPFAALAARRLILSEMQRNHGQISELATLDALHALAQDQGIVTPYSSMIVLVNNAQKRRLQELEVDKTRFQREAEGVGESSPAPFQVTGVPEPHEWLLIGLSLAILAWMAWQRRSNPRQLS